MMTETDVFVVGGPDVAWREAGGEIVILDLSGAVYFGLNATGAQLWKRLIDGASRADLVDQLSRQTDRDGRQWHADIDEFLADLEHYGLLRRTA